jgi:hypothetical protein
MGRDVTTVSGSRRNSQKSEIAIKANQVLIMLLLLIMWY